MSTNLAISPLLRARPDVEPAIAGLIDLVARGARTEGCCDTIHPGVRFARYSTPSNFQKNQAAGTMFTVVAQGRKMARWGASSLVFDPSRYLVVTGEGPFEGSVVGASAELPYLAVSVIIPPDVVAKVLLALAEPAATATPEKLSAWSGPLDGALGDNVVRFLQALEDPVARPILAPLALEEIVFRLLRSDAAAVLRNGVGPGQDAAQIQKAMQFMRANATRAISVETVARQVAMSPSHFAHRFRAVARVSPMRFLKQVRMDLARSLILAGGVRASEAATSVGYQSPSHFARDFKATFGAAPATYLRRFRQL